MAYIYTRISELNLNRIYRMIMDSPGVVGYEELSYTK